MRRGHHDARSALQGAHGKAQAGRGHQLLIDICVNAVSSEHGSGNACKIEGMNAAVIANGNAAVLLSEVSDHIVRQSLRRARNGIDVHTIGAGTQHTAHAACAELQLPEKCILDQVFLALHSRQVGSQLRIGHLSQPCLVTLGDHFVHVYILPHY